MNYSDKYKIAADLINKGYILHCTNEEFDSFEPSHIKGGQRAKEGYGFYFSDMPYKSIDYGSNWKIVKKEDFNFLDSNLTINYNMFDIDAKIFNLENSLDNARNIRQYDYIESELNKLKSQKQANGGEIFYNAIYETINIYGAKTIGQLEYNIPNPSVNIPKLIHLYISWGFDGYETDGIYTIFNFEKLNKLVKNVDVENYNLTESLDMSSFETQDELNKHFWKNEKLDSRVRLKLLDIADDFTDFLNVDWVKPEDITMTGSLANYNWSKEFSDIDLHIIIDFKKVDKRTDFVKEYFMSKKELWNKKHQGITIYGFPVELYVQDKNEPHASNGVYSLEKNKWIIKPEPKKIPQKNLNKAEEEAEKWMDKIDSLMKRYYPDLTDSQKEKVISNLDNMFTKIKDKRKHAFSSGGDETNKDNLTFKILRRNGYLDKIWDKKTEIYDDLMSINENAFGSKVVKNKKLYTLLKKEGLEGIILCKDSGYFYIDAITPEMQDVVYNLYNTSIYLNSFNQQTVEEWVEDIKSLITEQ
jgi:hypothetical protein